MKNTSSERILLAFAILVLGCCTRAGAQQNGGPLQPAPNGPPPVEPIATPAPFAGNPNSPAPLGDNRAYAPPGSLDSIGPCCDMCGGGSGCPPLWSVEQDVHILTRSRARDAMLVGDSLSVREPMTGKSLDFDIAPGYEGSLERYLGRDASNRDWFLEVGCWGFNNWVSTADALSSGQVTTNSPLGPVTHGSLVSPFQGQIFGPQGQIFGLDGADVINARYNSSFNSAEINLWVRPRSSPDRLVLHPDGSWHRECQPGLYTSFLFGFRYFNVEEQLHLEGAGTYVFDTPPITSKTITGDYYLNTRNNMYGFQLGAELMERDCRWEYGFRFKVAPMMNVVEGSSQLSTSSLGNVVLPPWVTTTQIAADIDLGAVATYKIHPNVAIKAGYDIAWLAGVGLAPEQVRGGNSIASLLSTGSSQTPNTHGTLFYQGLTLGLTWMR